MVVEKLKLLPGLIVLQDEGCEFTLEIFGSENTENRDIVIEYHLTRVFPVSNHYEEYKKFLTWYNRYQNKSCGFLYKIDGIKTDEEFVEAVEEIIKFLQANKVHKINQKGGSM